MIAQAADPSRLAALLRVAYLKIEGVTEACTPEPEQCDAVDNDCDGGCDGLIDEDAP